MPTSTRRRNLKPGPSVRWEPGRFEEESAGGKITKLGPSGGLVPFKRQVTVSEGHKKIAGKYRSGGPFYTTRWGRRYSPAPLAHGQVKLSTGSSIRWFGPCLFPQAIRTAFQAEEIPEVNQDLSRLGAEAISLCSPANPASEVGTGASELYREGIPALPGIPTWKERTALLRGAGSEYLNKVFGWDPLITEVEDLVSTVRKKRDILNQYSRNAGSNVMREFKYPLKKTESESTVSTSLKAVVGDVGSEYYDANEFGAFPNPSTRPGRVIRTSGTRTRTWFKGCFTYAVPSQSDSWKRLLGYGSKADILYGASLNPELLWNLTPWSWAVDWFSDAGDVINNISNYVRAGQIMRYGFVMQETESYIRYSADSSGYRRLPSPAVMEVFRISKVRQQANPYGFGIGWADLSTTQLAIAAALGITLA